MIKITYDVSETKADLKLIETNLDALIRGFKKSGIDFSQAFELNLAKEDEYDFTLKRKPSQKEIALGAAIFCTIEENMRNKNKVFKDGLEKLIKTYAKNNMCINLIFDNKGFIVRFQTRQPKLKLNPIQKHIYV